MSSLLTGRYGQDLQTLQDAVDRLHALTEKANRKKTKAAASTPDKPSGAAITNPDYQLVYYARTGDSLTKPVGHTLGRVPVIVLPMNWYTSGDTSTDMWIIPINDPGFKWTDGAFFVKEVRQPFGLAGTWIFVS